MVAFKRGQLKVLSVEWDRDLGGKDFDEVLFNHFVEEFDAKYKLDIRSNKRASFRLRLAVEKVPLFPSCNDYYELYFTSCYHCAEWSVSGSVRGVDLAQSGRALV